MSSERIHTPGRIKGYGYSAVRGCNWRKAWSKEAGTDKDPYLIQLLDYSLWIVPCHQPENTWGSAGNGVPRPPPDTSTFTGPFDNFDEAFATFVLMVTK